MNLAPLLRQTIAWQKATGENTRGEHTVGATTTVPCVAVPKMRDVFTATGETVTTARAVTMLTEPAIGDLLAGREVVAVETLVDYTGSTVGYRALTR